MKMRDYTHEWDGKPTRAMVKLQGLNGERIRLFWGGLGQSTENNLFFWEQINKRVRKYILLKDLNESKKSR